MLTSQSAYLRFCVLWTWVILTGLFLLLGWRPCRAEALEIRLGTGQVGTFSHFTAQQLCRVINADQAGLTCTPVPTPDDLDNLTNLRSGSLDIGLVSSRTLHDALHQADDFRYLDISYQNLRLILPMNSVPVSLVVRRDARISSLDQLAGKRINAGVPGTMEHEVMKMIMEAKGWSKSDFSLLEGLSSTQAQNTMALCHGTIQAMLHIGVHPDRKLEYLFTSCQATLAPMQDRQMTELIHSHPAYFQVTIPTDTYAQVPGPISTFGTKTLLVAPSDLDKDIVTALIQAIDRNLEQLSGTHPALSDLTVESPEIKDSKLHMHPGAAAYFANRDSP